MLKDVDVELWRVCGGRVWVRKEGLIQGRSCGDHYTMDYHGY